MIQTKQHTAAQLLVELLADGRLRPRDVRFAAARRGVRLDGQTWERAKRRVAVEAFRVGSTWYWSLPGWSAEGAADLLAGIERRLALEVEFQAFLAQRDRPRAGEQLRLA